jgi:hypothetical protein
LEKPKNGEVVALCDVKNDMKLQVLLSVQDAQQVFDEMSK